MERSEVREIDIRYKASGLTETINNLNRLIDAEEGVVVVSEKLERSDASVARSLNTIQGKYVEHHRLIQQVTRDMNRLHEARARGIVDENNYAAALEGMRGKLQAVANAQKEVVAASAKGWAGLTASSTGTYGPMMAQVKAAEDRIAALQRAEQKLRSINVTAATQSGQPGRAPADPNRARNYATSQVLMQGFDIVPQLASGVNPATVLLQQGPQIATSWAMAGVSMKEGLKDVGARVMGVITPIRVLTGGVAALGVAAVMAYSDWLDQQKQLEASLAGVGRGTGLTARGLNDIAVANAAAGEVSNATARQIVGTYAATGRIGRDTLGDLVKATRDYAATTGQEIPDAAAELAKAFADPAKGAEVLNGKLGILDASLKRTIDGLTNVGDTKAAQQALYSAMITGIDQAGNRLTWLGRTWEATKQAISNGWTALFEGPSVEQEITQLQARIAAASRGVFGPRGAGNAVGRSAPGTSQDEIRLKALLDQQERAAEMADSAGRRSRSLVAQGIAQSASTATSELIKMQAELAKLQRSLGEGGLLGTDRSLGVERIRELQAAIANFKTPDQLARQAYGFSIRGVSARSVEDRASLAADEARASALQKASTAADAERRASEAANLVRAQGAREAADYAASQAESARQGEAAAVLEARSIGLTAMEQDRLRIVMERTNEARQRAFQLTGDYNSVSADTIAAINREADAIARVGQAAREMKLARDLAFDRAQAGRARDEQAIYAKLQSEGMLTNGEIVTPQARAAADSMRATQTLAAQADLIRELNFETQQLGRSESERTIYARLNSAGLLDSYGRIKDQVTANIAEQMRWNDAIVEAQQAVKGLGAEMIRGGMEGGVNGALSAVADRLQNTMIDRAGQQIDNMLMSGISSLMGGPTTALGAAFAPKRDGSSAASALYVVPVSLEQSLTAAANPLSALMPGVVPANTNVPSLLSTLGIPTPANAAAPASAVPSLSAQNGPYAEMIRASALRYGIDPNVALRVAQSEGGTTGWVQSNVVTNGAREPSYGPFQALVGGPGTGFPAGMGNDMLRAGIDPRVPSQAYFDFAMQRAAQGGWTPWYGAANAGISRWQGIGGAAAPGGAIPKFEPPPSANQNTPPLNVQPVQQSFAQLQVATQQAATAIPNMTQSATTAAPALGGLGQQATGLGGALQSILGGIGQIGGGFLKMLGFESGGHTGYGATNAVAGYVHGQEFVAHAEATRRWRPMLEAMNAGRDPRMVMPVPVATPSGGGVSVRVNNYGPTQAHVEERDDGRGGRSIEVVVDEMQASNQRRPGSAAARTLGEMYGARVKTQKLG